MQFSEFAASLNSASPPDLPPLLTALWWERNNNWEKAHDIAQEVQTPDGSWMHAYLHRREGDAVNAGYWYRQAGRQHSRKTLEEEWREIAEALLAKS